MTVGFEPRNAGWAPEARPGAEPATGLLPLVIVDDPVAGTSGESDPGTIILTCASCGARMDERKCKLICACGYFLSCSDYY